MRRRPSEWTVYEQHLYLDFCRHEWAVEEVARLVKYVAGPHGAFVYDHAREARRVVEQLGRLNAERRAR